jgi:hypothetical protein
LREINEHDSASAQQRLATPSAMAPAACLEACGYAVNMARRGLSHCQRWRRPLLRTALCAGVALAARAQAADASEFWPELSAYVGLSEQTRLYLDASYARGKESDLRSLDLSAFLDVSIQPILREPLRTEDWQRARFLWARVGYTHVAKVTAGTREVPEDRGVLSVYAKAPLPAEVWLEARARADLRWIGGDYSTRYRARLEVTREFTLLEHTVVPYFNAEAFYDNRYDGLARSLYQLGAEVTLSRGFRYEIFLARQFTRLPTEERLNALGVVAKWYY